MKRTWIVLIISIGILITAFILFIFPGFYFSWESRKAESTTSGAPPPPSSSPPPSFSTGPPPTPSGSYSPNPSLSQSGTIAPSGSITSSPSGSVSVSPTTTQGTIEDILYGYEKRKEEIEKISGSVSYPVLGTTTIAAAAALALNPLLSLLFNFPFRDIFYFIFSSFLEYVGLRKRRRPWGVVYDSVTKKPIAGAVVKIIDAPSLRVKETRVTDNQGRFGFLVEKGIYQFSVAKNGYLFPSTKIVLDKNGSDGYYANVYLSGQFKIKEGFLGLNIPIDTVVSKVSSGYLWFLRFARFMERIRLPILIFGTILSLINIYFFRTIIDFVVLAIYILLWVFEIANLRKIKPYGEIKNESLKPLELAIVRFFKADNNKLISTIISDSHGRFYVLLPEGKYYFTVIKGGYAPFRSKIYTISRLRTPAEIQVILKTLKNSS